MTPARPGGTVGGTGAATAAMAPRDGRRRTVPAGRVPGCPGPPARRPLPPSLLADAPPGPRRAVAGRRVPTQPGPSPGPPPRSEPAHDAEVPMSAPRPHPAHPPVPALRRGPRAAPTRLAPAAVLAMEARPPLAPRNTRKDRRRPSGRRDGACRSLPSVAPSPGPWRDHPTRSRVRGAAPCSVQGSSPGAQPVRPDPVGRAGRRRAYLASGFAVSTG